MTRLGSLPRIDDRRGGQSGAAGGSETSPESEPKLGGVLATRPGVRKASPSEFRRLRMGLPRAPSSSNAGRPRGLRRLVKGTCVVQSGMNIGVPVRVFDAATGEDLGIAHVPLPVERGDELAVEGHPVPLEVVALVKMRAGAKIAAMVKVRHAAL